MDNSTINSNEEVSFIGISRKYEWSRSHWIRPSKSHAISYVDSDIILRSQTYSSCDPLNFGNVIKISVLGISRKR